MVTAVVIERRPATVTLRGARMEAGPEAGGGGAAAVAAAGASVIQRSTHGRKAACDPMPTAVTVIQATA